MTRFRCTEEALRMFGKFKTTIRILTGRKTQT